MAARCDELTHFLSCPREKPLGKQGSPNEVLHFSFEELPFESFHFSFFFVTIYYQRYLMPNLTWFPPVIVFIKCLCLSMRLMQPQHLALWLNLQLLIKFIFLNPGQPVITCLIIYSFHCLLPLPKRLTIFFGSLGALLRKSL